MANVDFDPFRLLYYNPELVVDCNVRTVEAAKAFYDLHPTTELYVEDSWLPPLDFNSDIFLLQNTQTINVSDLNRRITAAMQLDGYTQEEIGNTGGYLDFLKQEIVLTGVNTFRFVDETFAPSPSNFQVGDRIAITQDLEQQHQAVVQSLTAPLDVWTGWTFSVSNQFYDFAASNAYYVVNGSFVADADRLGRINYIRTVAASNLKVWDPNFNAELYQVLYPDTRLLTKEDCYLDYLTHYAYKDFRIGYATDILNNNVPLSIYNTPVRMNSNLTVYSKITLNDFPCRGFTSNSVDPGDLSRDDLLITERAAKSYTDMRFEYPYQIFSNMVIRSNLEVRGSTLLKGVFTVDAPTTMAQPVRIDADVDLRSDLSVFNVYASQDVHVDGNLFVTTETTLSDDVHILGQQVFVGQSNATSVVTLAGDLRMTGGVWLSPQTIVTSGDGTGGQVRLDAQTLLLSNADDVRLVLQHSSNQRAVMSVVAHGDAGLTGSVPGDLVLTASAAGNQSVLIGQESTAYTMRVQNQYVEIPGKLETGSSYTTSDARVKTDIQSIAHRVDDIIEGVRGCTFLRTDDPTRRRHMGLIAQAVRSVAPEAVQENENGMLSVAYGNLTAVLFEGLRDVRRRLDLLEAKIKSDYQ